ncbi:hypothetical protein [Ferrimonas marina]|uniref:Uncharacterized protein n=1 Tax=Ferrimonas marina TaxID=299255 RepID=A0A1M5YV74_9GAMM|nr:hypothetical protein [Ferrimonas marina]SHI15992.1 hypothetical protein SAMN02745129_4514 [Ferrimonas marina]
MTDEQREYYFGLAREVKRLERRQHSFSTHSGDDVTRWGQFATSLGSGIAAHLFSGSLLITLACMAVTYIGVELVLFLLRAQVEKQVSPLYKPLYEGYSLAADEGEQAKHDGLPESACPYIEDHPVQGKFAREWLDSYRQTRATDEEEREYQESMARLHAALEQHQLDKGSSIAFK